MSVARDGRDETPVSPEAGHIVPETCRELKNRINKSNKSGASSWFSARNIAICRGNKMLNSIYRLILEQDEEEEEEEKVMLCLCKVAGLWALNWHPL
jgi:hypothetical protein